MGEGKGFRTGISRHEAREGFHVRGGEIQSPESLEVNSQFGVSVGDVDILQVREAGGTEKVEVPKIVHVGAEFLHVRAMSQQQIHGVVSIHFLFFSAPAQGAILGIGVCLGGNSGLPVASDKIQNKGSVVLVFDVTVALEVEPENFDAASEVRTTMESTKETDMLPGAALGLVVEDGGDDGVQDLAGRCEIRKGGRGGQQGAATAKVDGRLPGLEAWVFGAVWAQRFCDACQDQQRQAVEGPGARFRHGGVTVWFKC